MGELRKVIFLITVFGGLLLRGLPASAQVGEQSSLEERMSAIEQQLRKLESRLEALEGAASGATVVQAGNGSEQGTPSAAIGDRLADLDQKLRIVERKRELEQEAEMERAKTVPVLGAGKEGFFLRSADGAFAFNMRGTLQADARFFTSAPAVGASTFLPYKVRPTFEWILFKNLSLRMMPDFGNGTTTLQDAYFDLTIWPWLKLRGGKFKGPVGLERLVQDTDVEFYERALPTNLVPNREAGFELWGEPWGGTIGYAGGIFNGDADGSSTDLDVDNHKDFEGRIFAHPFRKTSIAPLQGFGIGISGTSGRQIGTPASPQVSPYKTSSQQNFFRYRSDGTAPGTVVANGEHSRISPQAYYYWGRFGAWAEYVISQQEVRRGPSEATLRNAAWQFAGTYFVTGDKASYRTVSPTHAFDLGRGYWGAIELTARVSILKVDKSAFPIFADPAASPYGVRAWTVGVNWYLNKNVKLVFNFEQSDFLQMAGGVKRKTEEAFLERLQIAF